jgi:hypothetical protein
MPVATVRGMRIGAALPAILAFGLHVGSAAAWIPMPSVDAVVDTPAVRAVVAHRGERSTLWVQLTLRVSDGRLVLVVPLAASAALDEGEPAWFSAVESATAPRVFPPADVPVPECGGSATVEHTIQEPRAELAEFVVAHMLSDRTELAMFVEAEGLSPPSELGQHAGPFVALSYRVAEGAPLTIGLRLDAEEPLEELLPRLAPLGRWGPTPLTLVIIGEAPVLVQASRLLPQDIGATWFADRGESDYVEARHALLSQEPGELWVTETVGATALFETYFPDAESQVPPIFSDFRRRLEARGHECPDWSVLLSSARAQDESVAPACAEGLVAHTGLADCLRPDGLGPALACEGIADLWFALSGMRVSDVVLVRHVGFLPTEAALAETDGSSIEMRTVKVYAGALAQGECEPPPSPGSTGVTGFGGGIPIGTGGAPGQASGDGPNHVQPSPHGHVVIVAHPESCNCGSSGSSDGCSGDSSSSSPDESCNGDSSSTQAGDETCAGDSSSSSDTAGETCSSEGSADVEGDTCTGSSGGSGGDCALTAHGLPRPRLSILTLFFAAGLLPWRRHCRHRRSRRAT